MIFFLEGRHRTETPFESGLVRRDPAAQEHVHSIGHVRRVDGAGHARELLSLRGDEAKVWERGHAEAADEARGGGVVGVEGGGCDGAAGSGAEEAEVGAAVRR